MALKDQPEMVHSGALSHCHSVTWSHCQYHLHNSKSKSEKNRTASPSAGAPWTRQWQEKNKDIKTILLFIRAIKREGRGRIVSSLQCWRWSQGVHPHRGSSCEAQYHHCLTFRYSMTGLLGGHCQKGNILRRRERKEGGGGGEVHKVFSKYFQPFFAFLAFLFLLFFFSLQEVIMHSLRL